MSDVPHADGGTIVVTAENLLTGTGIIGSGSGGRFLPRQPIDEGGGGEEPPPEEPCIDVSAYPPEKQEALKVVLAAMEAAREIMKMADRDRIEYGVAIYRFAMATFGSHHRLLAIRQRRVMICREWRKAIWRTSSPLFILILLGHMIHFAPTPA